ncbi:hypothetical protein TNCV_2432461 [Trichonephila clavipes]|nr:hypothetical protein TNCV_2432461 [Trichonephila clavipes]
MAHFEQSLGSYGWFDMSQTNSEVNLVPRPKHNAAFVGFTRVNNQGESSLKDAAILGTIPVKETLRGAIFITPSIAWLHHPGYQTSSLNYYKHSFSLDNSRKHLF